MTTDLEKLHEEIRACHKCDLWKGRTKVVPGEGPENAKIMFVGLAPGATENKTGRPFVGRAGKLLNELLAIAGLKRKEVFITSVLKSMLPRNRLPKADEISACLPYLKKQIEIINPRIIVLLGDVAMRAILGKEVGKITDIHGKAIRCNGKIYFPTYHPAAGLRSAKIKRKQLEADFKKLKKLI
jgi:DNA polymerase